MKSISKDEDLFAIITDTPIEKEIPQFVFLKLKK